MKQKLQSPVSQYRLLSDEELVYRYAHRSEESAMLALYERYSHLAMGVCLQYLKDVAVAKQTTQEIFIKIVQDLPRFEITLFKPWLLQVCRNHCLIQLRKMGKESEALAATEFLSFENEGPAGISEEVMSSALAQAVTLLSTEQQNCIRQFYEQRKSYAAIAAGTGLSNAQIKQYIQQGKSILSQQMLHLSKPNPL